MFSIAIAGSKTIYDVGAVQSALKESTREQGSAGLLRKTYEKMCKTGGSRYVIKPSSTAALDELEALAPNFSAVIEDLRKYLFLAVAGNEPLNIAPLLLAGDPGVGKTHFAKMLARALSLDFEFCSMGSMTAGWVLSGSAVTWSGAKHGKVAQCLIEGDTANPMIVLDELDKCGADQRYDPMGTLLQLLEPETSTHFKDEFLDIPVDASAIMWVATANDLSKISSPILSRLNVYEVPAPTTEQARRIACMIYASILAEHTWTFSPELSSSAQEALSAVSPREMKKRLLAAMGTALMAGRWDVCADDIKKVSAGKKSSIGFLAA